jgi:hypothetical protein
MSGQRSTKEVPAGTRRRSDARPVEQRPRLTLASQSPPELARAVATPPSPGRSSTATTEAPSVVITHHLTVDGEEADALWQLYYSNLEPLTDFAVQKQYSERDEMMALFANPRVVKIIGREQGRAVGLAIVTNSLEDVPEISPRFLRRRYPDYAARDAIYCGMYVVVDPRHRGISLFHRLYIELWQVVAKASGVLIFDTCEFNREMFDVDNLAHRIASAFPSSTLGHIDRQTWYAAELPIALP